MTLDKYRIEGDWAIATLPSGTPTSFPASEIDVEATDELNKLGVHRGILLKGPDRTERNELRRRSDTVADLALGGYTDLQLPDREQKRPIGKTAAGNLDLFTLDRVDPSDAEVASAVRSALRAQGQTDTLLFAGSQETRLLLDVTTDNELEVLRALSASAAALLAARSDHPGLEALEVIMSTEQRLRAAQFLLTPEGALSLVENRVTPEVFFLLNVQF